MPLLVMLIDGKIFIGLWKWAISPYISMASSCIIANSLPQKKGSKAQAVSG